jgi:hypothetical protein
VQIPLKLKLFSNKLVVLDDSNLSVAYSQKANIKASDP